MGYSRRTYDNFPQLLPFVLLQTYIYIFHLNKIKDIQPKRAEGIHSKHGNESHIFQFRDLIQLSLMGMNYIKHWVRVIFWLLSAADSDSAGEELRTDEFEVQFNGLSFAYTYSSAPNPWIHTLYRQPPNTQLQQQAQATEATEQNVKMVLLLLLVWYIQLSSIIHV